MGNNIGSPFEGSGQAKIFVYTSPCSFLRGGFQTRFVGTHRILAQEEIINVFRYPGISPVYISTEQIEDTKGSVVLMPEGTCNGSETDIIKRRNMRTVTGLN